MTAVHDHGPAGAALGSDARARLGRRAQLLAGASVAYNGAEAVIALAAGAAAGSAALIGFGLDSVVEVSSGMVILWQFRHRLPESRERQALRLIALSLFALAGYVLQDSVRALLSGAQPDASPVGIVLAATSLAIMPLLSRAQRRTGRALHSSAVVADATQTLLCSYLSAVLLAGLVLNAALGWSWADPVAGLVIAAIALREGLQAWRGEGCCGPAAPGASSSGAAACASAPVVGTAARRRTTGTAAAAADAAVAAPGRRTHAHAAAQDRVDLPLRVADNRHYVN